MYCAPSLGSHRNEGHPHQWRIGEFERCRPILLNDAFELVFSVVRVREIAYVPWQLDRLPDDLERLVEAGQDLPEEAPGEEHEDWFL